MPGNKHDYRGRDTIPFNTKHHRRKVNPVAAKRPGHSVNKFRAVAFLFKRSLQLSNECKDRPWGAGSRVYKFNVDNKKSMGTIVGRIGVHEADEKQECHWGQLLDWHACPILGSCCAECWVVCRIDQFLDCIFACCLVRSYVMILISMLFCFVYFNLVILMLSQFINLQKQ